MNEDFKFNNYNPNPQSIRQQPYTSGNVYPQQQNSGGQQPFNNGNAYSQQQNATGQQPYTSGNVYPQQQNSGGQQPFNNGNAYSQQQNATGQQPYTSGNVYPQQQNSGGQQPFNNGNAYFQQQNATGQQPYTSGNIYPQQQNSGGQQPFNNGNAYSPPPMQGSNQQQLPYSQRPFNINTPNGHNNSPAPNTAGQNGTNYNYAPQNQNMPSYAPPSIYYPYYYTPSPHEKERQEVKRASSFAGKTTLIIFLIMQGLGILVMLIAMGCGIIDLKAMEDDPYMGFQPIGFYLYEGMLSLVSIVIPTLILAKVSKAPLEKLIPFKKIEGKRLAAIVVAGMSLCMLSQIIAALFGINMSLFGIDIYNNLDSESPSSVFDLIMGTICTAIIPALVEEFAYRGLVVGTLKKHGDLFAVFTSAFLFGMLHGNFAQIPFAFVVGLVLGYVRVKTDSMLPSILIHFCNNFYAVLVTTTEDMMPSSVSSIFDYVIMIVLVVAGFIALSYLAKNHKDLFENEEKNQILTFKEKVKTFFSSGFIIADTIILSLTALFLVFNITDYV